MVSDTLSKYTYLAPEEEAFFQISVGDVKTYYFTWFEIDQKDLLRLPPDVVERRIYRFQTDDIYLLQFFFMQEKPIQGEDPFPQNIGMPGDVWVVWDRIYIRQAINWQEWTIDESTNRNSGSAFERYPCHPFLRRRYLSFYFDDDHITFRWARKNIIKAFWSTWEPTILRSLKALAPRIDHIESVDVVRNVLNGDIRFVSVSDLALFHAWLHMEFISSEVTFEDPDTQAIFSYYICYIIG